MAYVFQKKSGAPAGTINLDVGGITYLIDDSTHSTISVTDTRAAADLFEHPFLQLSGGSGTYTPPPTVQEVMLVNGVLSVISSNGTYIDVSPVIRASQGVQLATTAAVPAHTGTDTMTATANGALSIDSIPVVVNNRVLVKDEVNAAHNGIFTVTATGSLTTPWSMTRTSDVIYCGMGVPVGQGLTNQGAVLVQTTPDPIVVGTSNLVFSGPPINIGASLTAQNVFVRRQRTAISPSARDNLATRPRPGLAPNLTNYGYDHATLTQANDYTPNNPIDGLQGTPSMVAKAVLTGTGQGGFRTVPTSTETACSPGDTISASAYFQQKAGNSNTQGRILINWLNSSNATISTTSGSLIVYGTGVWVQFSVNAFGPAPAGTTHAQVSFQATASSAAAVGDTAWVDGIVIEKNVAAVGPYFDGTSSGCSWDTTAYASISHSPGENAYWQGRDLNNAVTVCQIDSSGKGFFVGVDAQSNRITNVSDPSGAQDAVTKAYGDLHYGSAGASAPTSSLPATIYGTTGRELSIYWEAFFRSGGGIPIENYQFDVTCAVGEQDKYRWFYTPTDPDATAGTAWSVAVSYNGTLLGTYSTSLVMVASNSPVTPVTRKVVTIGDSLSAIPLTTAGIGWLAEEINVLSGDTHFGLSQQGASSGGQTDSTGTVRTIKTDAVSGKTAGYFVGTFDPPTAVIGVGTSAVTYTGNTTLTSFSSTIRHVVAGTSTPLSVSVTGTQITVNLATNGSGVATSTAAQVVTAVNGSGAASALVTASGSGAGVAAAAGFTSLTGGNPFYINGAFNFGQYLTNTGISLAASDWVRIHLGANDVFSPTDDATALTNATTALANMATMITSIKAAVSGIRIGIHMTIPPTSSQDGFGFSYGTGQTRDRYNRNRGIWLEQLKATYDSGAVANVFLVPWHLSLDNRNGFPNAVTSLSARNANKYYMVVNSLHPVGTNTGINSSGTQQSLASTGFWQVTDAEYAFYKAQA